MNKSFSDWLEGELARRGWRQAELARRAGVSRAAISNVIRDNRQPGPELCRAIAKALDLPDEQVFRQAGLLEPEQESPPGLREWVHAYVTASPEDRKSMLQVAKVLSRK